MDNDNNNSANELYHSLKRLNRLMHRQGHRGEKAGGLHRGQAYLLQVIGQNDGAVQRDLSEIIDIRPSSLTEVLLRLEQEGLIERRQDEKDQRLMHIHLTEAGRQAIGAAGICDEESSQTMFSCLTQEEISAMAVITGKLCANLESMAGPEEDRRCHHIHSEHHRCGHEESPGLDPRRRIHPELLEHEHHGHEHHEHEHPEHEHHGHEHHGHEHHDHEHHGHEHHEHEHRGPYGQDRHKKNQ